MLKYFYTYLLLLEPSIPALLWPYNSNFHALCQNNFSVVLIPTFCHCKSVFFLLAGGEPWSCLEALSTSQVSCCMVCKSGHDGGITQKVLGLLVVAFQTGSWRGVGGVVIVGGKGRSLQLGHCPGGKSPFDCI